MELLRLLAGIRTPFFDFIFGLITGLGEETAGIIILCGIYWCISKQAAYRMGIAYFLSGLTVQGIKISFRIDRPWVIDPGFHPVQSAIQKATGYSFPSGHTQGATAMFGSLGAQLKRKSVKAACFLLAILVAFSRMYLEVHTLLDVSAAFLISLLFALFSVKFAVSDSINKKREFVLFIILVFYAAFIIVLAAELYSSGIIELHYLSDCMKSVGAAIGFATGMYIERVYIRFTVSTKNAIGQIIKLIFGIAGLLAIKEGSKLIAITGLVFDTARYFLMLLWITVFFPLIIQRFFAASERLPESRQDNNFM